MDLSQQYVYRVYLEKSFTLAANALFVSQPALSAMVSKLEKKIGFRIFGKRNARREFDERKDLEDLKYPRHVSYSQRRMPDRVLPSSRCVFGVFSS